FALDKAGAVTVPINWRLTPSEVGQVVNDVNPKLLIAGEQFSGSVGGVRCRTLGFADLPRADGGDPHRDQEDAVTWQLYTSGTTGVPKGAMLTNRNLLGLVGPLGFEAPEVVEGSRSLVAMPLYHIGGSGWALAALAYGATVVVVREVLPPELLKVIVEQRVETGFLVPAVLLFM